MTELDEARADVERERRSMFALLARRTTRRPVVSDAYLDAVIVDYNAAVLRLYMLEART